MIYVIASIHVKKGRLQDFIEVFKSDPGYFYNMGRALSIGLSPLSINGLTYS